MTCCQVTTLLCKIIQTHSSSSNTNNTQLLWITQLQVSSAPHVLKETSVHPAKDQSSVVSTRDCCMLTGKKSVSIQTLQGRRKTFEITMGQVILGPGTEKSTEWKILPLLGRSYRYTSVYLKGDTPNCCDKFCFCSLFTEGQQCTKTPQIQVYFCPLPVCHSSQQVHWTHKIKLDHDISLKYAIGKSLVMRLQRLKPNRKHILKPHGTWGSRFLNIGFLADLLHTKFQKKRTLTFQWQKEAFSNFLFRNCRNTHQSSAPPKLYTDPILLLPHSPHLWQAEMSPSTQRDTTWYQQRSKALPPVPTLGPNSSSRGSCSAPQIPS